MEVDYNLINGCDEYIQLLKCFVSILKFSKSFQNVDLITQV